MFPRRPCSLFPLRHELSEPVPYRAFVFRDIFKRPGEVVFPAEGLHWEDAAGFIAEEVAGDASCLDRVADDEGGDG